MPTNLSASTSYTRDIGSNRILTRGMLGEGAELSMRPVLLWNLYPFRNILATVGFSAVLSPVSAADKAKGVILTSDLALT